MPDNKMCNQVVSVKYPGYYLMNRRSTLESIYSFTWLYNLTSEFILEHYFIKILWCIKNFNFILFGNDFTEGFFRLLIRLESGYNYIVSFLD
mgnify:CR=1 FL=1